MKTTDRRHGRTARPRQRGTSLIEVMMVTAMMMTVLTTVGVGLRSAHQSRREMERRAQMTAVASELADRLFRIPFGAQGAATATPAQLDELFDDDDELGSATLTGLRTAVGSQPFSFSFAGFPWGGQFEVRVDSDLNGDGDAADVLEGRADVLRINISWNGVLLLESTRCAPWKQT